MNGPKNQHVLVDHFAYARVLKVQYPVPGCRPSGTQQQKVTFAVFAHGWFGAHITN